VFPINSSEENMGLDFIGVTSTYPMVWITTKPEMVKYRVTYKSDIYAQ
jgi:hypothetical protein